MAITSSPQGAPFCAKYGMRRYIDIITERQQPALPQGFSEWFAGSKVVDQAGNPQVCYHGTYEEFASFSYSGSPGKTVGSSGFNRVGFWFDTDPGVPNWLAGTDIRSAGQMSAGVVMPVYLSIKNPFWLNSEMLWDEDRQTVLDLTARITPMSKAFYDSKRDPLGNYRMPDGSVFDELLWRKLVKQRDELQDRLGDGRERSDSFWRLMKLLPDGMDSSTEEVAAFQQELINEGHDGIYMADTIADWGHRNYSTTDWWIAFHPNQIKSIYAKSVSDSEKIDEDSQHDEG